MDIKELKKLVRQSLKEAKAKNSMLLASPDLLTESSLSRLYGHMVAHDTAIVTAFRGKPSDDSNCTDAAEVGAAEDENTALQTNKRRNRDLKAALLNMGYGVTAVDGSYIEHFDTPEAYEPSAEDSFFVVNLKDIPSSKFFDSIIPLGQKYCQDSVMLVPKGAEGAFLYGTNNAEFPGYGSKVDLGSATFGKEAEFMTKVRNRPMAFAEGLDTYEKLPRLQRMAVKSIAKRVLKETS